MPYRVVITKPGSPSVLDIQNIEIPVPKADEICIQVHFAGINFADTLMRMGFYQPRPPFPFTPGYEVSGVIHTLGSDVKEFEVGQRVVGMMRTGGQATHVVTEVSRVIPIPEEMTLEAAASMPVTYITAHHMLHHLGNLKPTDSVLIHGGGGGVGTAALQLCKWAGVKKVWSTASSAKAEIIQSYGATAIDRHNEDFVDLIKKATDGKVLTTFLTQLAVTTSNVAYQSWPMEENCTLTGCLLLLLHQSVLFSKHSLLLENVLVSTQ
jgi:NADPH:quinone reductase-like Zn-dependent oxidoreductase